MDHATLLPVAIAIGLGAATGLVCRKVLPAYRTWTTESAAARFAAAFGLMAPLGEHGVQAGLLLTATIGETMASKAVGVAFTVMSWVA